MYIPKPYFENIPKMGSLMLDCIFVENGYPILFTCSNDEKLYLCLCRTTYKEQKWIVSEINIDILEKLLKNEISIYYALKNDKGKACIVRWEKDIGYDSFRVDMAKFLDDTDLPDKDVFLDDDEGDFREYLLLVRNREQNLREKQAKIYFEDNERKVRAQISIDFSLYKFIYNDVEKYYNNAIMHIEDNERDLVYIEKSPDSLTKEELNHVSGINCGEKIGFAA